MMKNYLIFAFISINLFYYAKSQFTEDGKKEIVTSHNRVRSEVDPPAADMVEMEWNETLGKMAQKWSENCLLMFPTAKEYQKLGISLYRGWARRKDWVWPQKSVLAWEEGKRYLSKDYLCIDGDCENYRQMTYAKSTDVGCGFKKCYDAAKYYVWEVIVTCLYSVDYFRGRTHTPGPACSLCSKTEYPGCINKLCSKRKEKAKNDGKLIQISYIIKFLFLLLQVRLLYCPL